MEFNDNITTVKELRDRRNIHSRVGLGYDSRTTLEGMTTAHMKSYRAKDFEICVVWIKTSWKRVLYVNCLDIYSASVAK